jgi:hypothetical protein
MLPTKNDFQSSLYPSKPLETFAGGAGMSNRRAVTVNFEASFSGIPDL